MSSGGSTLTVFPPQSIDIKSSLSGLVSDRSPHTVQDAFFERFVSRNSGPAKSIVSRLFVSRVGNPTRNLVAALAAKTPVNPVLVGATPRFAQLSSSLSATPGRVHRRQSVDGGLYSARCACSPTELVNMYGVPVLDAYLLTM